MYPGRRTLPIARGVLFAMVLAAPACTSRSAAEKANTRPPPLVIVSRVVARDVPVEVRGPRAHRPRLQAHRGA
jgi:hypothetical protein